MSGNSSSNSSSNSIISRSPFDYGKWRTIMNPEREHTIPSETEAVAFVKRAKDAAAEFATLTFQQMVDLCPRVEFLDVYDYIDEDGKGGIEEMFELQIWNAVTNRIPEATKRRVRDEASAKQERAEQRKAADAWHRYGVRYPW